MDAEDRPAVTEPDIGPSPRVRTETADAALIAGGVAMGLPLVLARRAPDRGTRVSAER